MLPISGIYIVRDIRSHFLAVFLVLCAAGLQAQQLIIKDSDNNNQVVNGTTVVKYTSDPATIVITANFVMKNNTDKPLIVFLKKKINHMADSTTDFFCFSIKCWANCDSTDLADTIQPGDEHMAFMPHACHINRDLSPPMAPGYTSITYTLYDNNTFPTPVEAKVTVDYHLGALGIESQHYQQLGVYPNPASSSFAIDMGDEFMPGDCMVTVFNCQGKQVFSTLRPIENQRVTVPVSSFPNGIYFGTLARESGLTKQFKFIVQR